MAHALDVEKVFRKAVKLLKSNKYIIFDSLLHPQLGVGDTWYYRVLMHDKEKRETIKQLMAENASRNTTDKLKKLDEQEDTTAITNFLKINNRSIRNSLSTVREEHVDIPYDTKMEKEELLSRLDELENE